MSMDRWIEGQRRKGNAYAVKFGQFALEQFGEVPLQAQDYSEQKSPREQNLCRETFGLLAKLRKPTAKERRKFEAQEYIFLSVEAKSLEQVYADNSGYFDQVNSSQNLMSYTPPKAFEVALNLKKLLIPQSNNSSQDRQLKQTEEYSKREIESKHVGAKAIMLPATAVAQLDIEYQKRHNGEKLIPDFWVRALDITVEPDVADVGRDRPGSGLGVDGWRAGGGDPRLWALAAVVFVRK